MPNVPDWKTAVKYVIGMLVLAVSVALALYLPGWYTEWQDEKTNGQITLSYRDQITFLDTASLDMAGKIKVLTESSDIYMSNEVWEYSPVYYSDISEEERQMLEQYFGMRPGEMIQKCSEIMQKWSDAEVFPQACAEMIQEENLVFMSAQMVYADDSILAMIVMLFWLDDDSVVLVADPETEIIYYAHTIGTSVMNFMARELGYSSYSGISEGTKVKQPKKTEEYELENLCGAEASVVTGEGGLEFDGVLQYANFESSAARSVIASDMGFGLSMWFGSRQLEGIMGYLMEDYGGTCYRTDTSVFLDACSGNMNSWVETETAVECSAESLETETEAAAEDSRDKNYDASMYP